MSFQQGYERALYFYNVLDFLYFTATLSVNIKVFLIIIFY